MRPPSRLQRISILPRLRSTMLSPCSLLLVSVWYLLENRLTRGLPVVLFMPLYMFLGKRYGMTRFIPITMFFWGLLTLCNAFIKTQGQLIALRLLIGVCESGWYPAIVYYFSSCYTRYDLGLRVALLYGALCLGGACSGLLAYGILQIKGALHGWQYLFLIDGGISGLEAPILVKAAERRLSHSDLHRGFPLSPSPHRYSLVLE